MQDLTSDEASAMRDQTRNIHFQNNRICPTRIRFGRNIVLRIQSRVI